MPSPLIGILDTPQPILVGITRLDYEHLTLDDEEKATKTWIFLDDQSIVNIEWGEFDADLDHNLNSK